MSKIIITGVAGLIGSNLARLLLDRDYEVIGIDNFCIGPKSNLTSLFAHPHFTFHELDVLSEAADNVDTYEGAKAIYHLAAFKIPFGDLKATDVLLLNLKATEKMLEIARQISCLLVLASTSDVYGKSPDMPFREDGNLVLGPSHIARWSYAASKIFDEHLCLAYHREFGVPVSIIRYFNAYGPGHDLSMVSGGPQALFIEAMIDDKEITLLGDGEQKRCFCYISDTVEGTAAILDHPDNAVGEILNIGNDQTETTIRGLAELCNELIRPGKSLKARFLPHEKIFGKFEEVQRRVPDLSKAERLLGFKPKVGNREGLERTIAWHRSLREK